MAAIHSIFQVVLALVTGGGGGLGFAIARGLAAAGARVVLNGRNRDKLDAAVSALSAERFTASAAAFDVTVGQSRRGRRSPRSRGTIGPLDIVVNNAAVNQRAALDAFSTEQWRTLLAANLDGPFFVARSVIPGMRARRRGKIINICSLASEIGRPNIVPYAASKGGLQMLTRALAVELAPHNVQVNGIAPGFFKTDMNAPLIANAEFSAWVAKRTPAGRWGDPPEIAGAAVFLASGAADYVTGHVLFVDGGFSVSY